MYGHLHFYMFHDHGLAMPMVWTIHIAHLLSMTLLCLMIVSVITNLQIAFHSPIYGHLD